MKLIKGKAGGFFTPQEEGGKCKLTVIFEDRPSQDAAFMMRYQDVVIGLTSENEGDVEKSPYESEKEVIISQIDNLITKVKEDCKPSLLKESEGDHPVNQ